MERPFEYISAITNKKNFWKLAVRVKDKWTVVKDGKEHLEMIIVDANVRPIFNMWFISILLPCSVYF